MKLGRKSKNLPKNAIGRWARVHWDDTGIRDMVVVELNDERTRALVYAPFDECTDWADADQFEELRSQLVPPKE